MFLGSITNTVGCQNSYFLFPTPRQSNEDELSWKSTLRIDLESTGSKKKGNFFGFSWGFCMDFLGNQTRMNFPGNWMGAVARTDPKSVWSKKKAIFFCFPWGFCMDFLRNQTRMNFPRNQMGAVARWRGGENRSRKCREQRKGNFFCFP